MAAGRRGPFRVGDADGGARPCPRFDGPRLGLPEDNVAGVGGEGRGSGAVPVGGHVDEQLHCEDRGEGRVQPVAAGDRLSCKRAGNGAAGGWMARGSSASFMSGTCRTERSRRRPL